MFSLRTSSPSKIKGKIKVKKRIWGLGRVEDVDGETWDIACIYGNEDKTIVNACKYSLLHPYYKDTSGDSFGFVEQTWEPYEVVIVK